MSTALDTIRAANLATARAAIRRNIRSGRACRIIIREARAAGLLSRGDLLPGAAIRELSASLRKLS